MGLRRWVRRLEEAAKGETMTLVCPVCAAEFVARGDVPLEFIVHQRAAEAGEKGHHETPEGVLRIFAHEHEPSPRVEKGSGLPFLSGAVSGIDIGAIQTHAGAGDEGGS
jgi:hypothetical protein